LFAWRAAAFAVTAIAYRQHAQVLRREGREFSGAVSQMRGIAVEITKGGKSGASRAIPELERNTVVGRRAKIAKALQAVMFRHLDGAVGQIHQPPLKHKQRGHQQRVEQCKQ
jgi:hypothetical protein